jgi:hypothetical protein
LSLVYTILFALAHLALVRIFLEMALKFLVEPREGANPPEDLRTREYGGNEKAHS